MISSQSSNPNEVPSQRNLIVFASALGVLLLYATYIFGLNVLLITGVSIAFAFLVEAVFAKVRKKTIEKAWIIVPLIFALMMPPTATWWMAAIGSTFGVFFGKAIFGGLGKNVFHPSVVGILFLYFAFPPYMLTKWLNPVTEDVVATATPLITLNRGIEFPYSVTDLLLGNVPGAIGETFRLGIIVLGLLLILLKIIDWKAPLAFLTTIFVVNFAGGLLSPEKFKDPLLSLLVGGVIFAAFFLVSDASTAPKYPYSKIIYGVGVGLITVIIRNFATFPEGVVFAVIIMNALAPIIDSMKINQKFSEVAQ
jgi:RnfABCDGE-type electron transport complex D subunit